MKAWTDYPFRVLGDEPYKKAPIREIDVISYDGDKYCKIVVSGVDEEIKAGYIYTKPGRCGEVPSISFEESDKL